jgi:hypothetical protein
VPEILDAEDVEIEQQDVAQMAPSALAILNQSEHAAMVTTANLNNNRRRLSEFDSKLKAYASHSQPIALSMFYSMPRAGKQIIGPSVRFAEIVAPCWKNCAVAARGIGDSAGTVTAQGVFLDYEANLRNAIEIPRRITDKNGQRYSDDMIVTTLNAAMSVARRNAVLKGGVPQALWTPAYEEAQLTAVGKAMSHAQRVAEAIEYLNKLGVTEWQILNSVGVPSPKELEVSHLLTLRVLCQEVKRGDKTIEEVFGSVHDKEIDALFAQLKMNDTQQRMLRNSYMGRAKELLDYLRSRLTPTRSTTEARPAPAAESVKPAATAGPVPPLGTVKDGKTKTGADGDLEQQWSPEERQREQAPAFQSEPQQTVDDRVAQASTPAFSEERLAVEPQPEAEINSGPEAPAPARPRGRPRKEPVQSTAVTDAPEGGAGEDFSF